MLKTPLPFIIKKPKFPKSKNEQREPRRTSRMTLVAALSGSNGTILFADTEEVVGSYSTRTIDKLEVWDCENFRLGIAGASTDGTYADMLQSEILGSLSRLQSFDMREAKSTLALTLTEFYGKHIWPRLGDKPQMEYLLVIQPLPQGYPEVIQISETAANIIQSREYTTIGVGRYLADYIFKQLFQAPPPVSGNESISFLCGAGIHVAKEVRENIEGVGPVERVAMFGCDGGYDELYPVDILEIESNMSSIQEFLGYWYSDAMDAEKSGRVLSQEDETGWANNILERHKTWYAEWKERRENRRILLEMERKRRNAG